MWRWSNPMRTLSLASALLITGIISTAADRRPEPPPITPAMVDAMDGFPGALGPLPEVVVPADNPQTPRKIDLGKRLFFDNRLSLDQRSSCATCHNPNKAYADGLVRSRGFQGIFLRRNSPTLLNAAYAHSQFWDGRAATLDDQCKAPLLSPLEMNMLDEQHLVDRLNHVTGYRRDFQAVFGSGPSLNNVARAIAAFERTLTTPGSRFDRYAQGAKSALTEDEKRGLIVFFGKGSCSECHKGPTLTDDQFHNIGTIPGSGAPKDLGRYEVTLD